MSGPWIDRLRALKNQKALGEPTDKPDKFEIVSNVSAAPWAFLETQPDDPSPVVGPAAEARRQRALAMLVESPKVKRAATFDLDANPDYVLCTVAIRHVGTCELLIPPEKYDPWAILEAVEKSEQ